MDLQGIVFGPVPSRRLGRSLGVNNIPYKVCTYACVYCQLGRNLKMTSKRQPFYDPTEIYNAVESKVRDLISKGEQIDYITFVPDGEPTLDINLGKEVSLIKRLGYSLAIITNASLIWDRSVQNDLMKFDLVSVKVDAVTEELWRKIDRSFKDLDLSSILEGIRSFSGMFKGKLISETMLVDNVDYGDEFEKISEFLSTLVHLDNAYISIPTRPPLESWAKPPKEDILNEAFQIFESKLGNRVELLIGYEGSKFSHSGNIEVDLLSILAVHPMREDAVIELLKEDNASYEVVENLIKKGLIKRVQYGRHAFYIRRFT